MAFSTGMARRLVALAAAAAVFVLCVSAVAQQRGGQQQRELPPFSEVSEGFEQVISTADGRSFYNLWTRDRDGAMLAELPRGFERQRHFIALTVAAGDLWAGLQSGDMYVYWKRYDNRLALIEPNVGTRSTGDRESRTAVDRHFTDRVILDVPIVSTGPNGQPVIDMKALLVGQIQRFYGRRAQGANANLATVAKAKAFPENVEIAYEMPVAGGRLMTFHYSISLIPDSTGYRPREADERVGYFTTVYRDLGKFRDDEKWVRYINRWHLEKAEPRLRMSPPKNPIVFYVEHTVPVRYRRWVREGVLYWNKAFENVGIVDAIEVYFQDKATGAHMDKDPEDVRYNFIRWLSNDLGTAIGPSRVHPLTGQILNGDVVLTDGWIRYFWYEANELLPEFAMEGFAPETLAWLDKHPEWDPRVRLAHPGEREGMVAERERRGVQRFGGHPAAVVMEKDDPLRGEMKFDGLVNRVSQFNTMCMAAQAKGFDMALMRMNMELLAMLDDEPEEGGEGEGEGEDRPRVPWLPEDTDGDKIDGIPEWFVGPALAELVAHEIGHTIGLRHNFKASSVHPLDEINSPEMRGERPWSASVMDYNPVNINTDPDRVQGDYSVIHIGAYDKWAIEYGYTFEEPKKVLERVAEPELQYATDEDTWGPDPLARRYDLGADPLDFALSRMELVRHHRENLLDHFVKEGQSWARARRGYNITLSIQMQMVNMMANWIGGAHVYRDRKGDPEGRAPIDVVDADAQRRALEFVLDHAFHDEAFGLTPELLRHMTVDRWWDAGGFRSIFEDPTWPVHDRIMGIQASALTMLMNPTTLQRVYDNEFRVPEDQDIITLPEMIDSVSDTIWSEVQERPRSRYTARKPMISSLRRNLQREHLSRMIHLSMPGSMSGAAARPISNLATMKLRDIREKIGAILDTDAASRVDAYTRAHLSEAALRIDKALDAKFIYSAR